MPDARLFSAFAVLTRFARLWAIYICPIVSCQLYAYTFFLMFLMRCVFIFFCEFPVSREATCLYPSSELLNAASRLQMTMIVQVLLIDCILLHKVVIEVNLNKLLVLV
jgi:hypothetical protein